MVINITAFADRDIAVLGLGRTGMAAARALAGSGARVWAWDDDEGARARAAAAGVNLIDLHACDWKGPAALVLSPGIPHTHPRPHPAVERARAAGCRIIGDVEVLARAQPDAVYVGVTGTNGKSTTTAMVGHILGQSGRRIETGGNLGQPVLEFEPLGADGIYLLEMSSFQLELTHSIVFDVAVLLNLDADHLERHGGMEGYVAAKRSIFDRQAEDGVAVVGIDDDGSRSIYDELMARRLGAVVPVSGAGRAAGGVYALDGVLHDDMAKGEGGEGTPVLDLRSVAALPGRHNWQNAAAAYATARAVGIDSGAITDGIRGYPGLAHRQEPVALIAGVAYINDSKATNPAAAARALGCYTDIYWIAGGRPKEGGLEAIEPYLGRVRHAFLIGEAAPAFAAALEGKAEFTISGDLATALGQARARAAEEGAKGPVVLLSPACASFDQFSDFEARGEAFRGLVEELA